jgi:hypothetical protein
VQFSSAETKPGEAVSVNVKASPFSQVGLLAVDKSVLLLDKGNDFSVSQVFACTAVTPKQLERQSTRVRQQEQNITGCYPYEKFL